MAKTFAIISAILLAASAYLAFKNKQAYEDAIEQRVQVESDLGRNQAKLAGLQSDIEDTTTERTGVEETTVTKKEEQGTVESEVAGLKSSLETKRSERDDNAAKIEEIEAQTAELGDVQEIAGKIRAMKEQITDLEDEKSGKEALRANLLAEQNSTQGTIGNYSEENAKVSRQESFFGSARISSVYGSWGFVTISAGNSSGVVTGSTLNVIRGGEVIAKLRVRSVESNRASADLVPDSAAEDTVLQVGDLVKPATKEEN